MEQISNDEWFEANLNPDLYRPKLGIQIPGLPPNEVQLGFTGRQGRENLQQAFDFYKFVVGHLPNLGADGYDVLDFGGGWGRILRFFLRDFQPGRLILADCMTQAVESARGLNSPFKIVHSNVNPPLPIPEGSIGLCYAYSVFSHLSENMCCAWLPHFAKLLVPGGKLIVTTRGLAQTYYMDALTKTDSSLAFLTWLPKPEVIRDRLRNGVFQFYPGGGGGELTTDFFGEAWIPQQWLEERYVSFGFSSCDYYPEFDTVDQCVFILTK